MSLATYNGYPGDYRVDVSDWLTRRFRAGELTPPTECEACGNTEYVQAHLENYADPANYVPLCGTCHMMLHTRHRTVEAWDRYREWVATGFRHQPTRKPFLDFKRTVARLDWTPPPWQPTERRLTYLDLVPDRQRHPGRNPNYRRTLTSSAPPPPAPPKELR